MIEISGQEKKIEAFIEAVRPYGIRELARTGRIALVRGSRPPRTSDEPTARRRRGRRRPSWDIPTCDEPAGESTAELDRSAERRRAASIRTRRCARDCSIRRRADPSTDSRISRRPPMPATMYYDQDADLGAARRARRSPSSATAARGTPRPRTCATRAATSSSASGRARPTTTWPSSDGFKPVSAAEAAEAGDLVNILLPDEVQGDIYARDIKPEPQARATCCSARTGSTSTSARSSRPRASTAPWSPRRGPGHLVRSEFVKGGGVPCLIATGEGCSPGGKALALAYAKGIGGTRGGVLQTTFAEETETDLFGEQVVLCGGVSALVKMGFETLIEAGYQPESAYFECLHELKLIVDLMYQGGLNYMRYSISNTAEYGDYTRGPRIVNEQTRAEMKKILQEIQIGPVRPRVDPREQGQPPRLQRHQAAASASTRSSRSASGSAA